MNTSSRSLLAIVGALNEELSALVGQLENAQITHHGGREFHCGRLDGQDLVLVATRIGKVAAATTTTLLIERFNVRRILFTGVAGGLGDSVCPGDIVIGRTLMQHDMDASPLFPRFEVPLTGHSQFAAHANTSESLFQAATQALADVSLWLEDTETLRAFKIRSPQIHQGLIVSGDCFIASTERHQALRAAVPEALAVEMEGAAVAQVCHDLDVPFALLRTISDRADEAAHQDFQRFISEVAARYTATIVRTWLRQVPKLMPKA
jgi:adenosylhomocysteine nucleosidase